MNDTLQTAHTDGADPAKRRQILHGAREVFLAKGYDGASMDGIAKAAGVSKGTLYVYFQNKECLFEALITEQKRTLAENLFDTAGDSTDFRAHLVRIARRYLDYMAAPEHIASIRMVIGAMERFPAFGPVFYAAGPQTGIEKLAAIFRTAVAAGRLREDCDVGVAAGHFMDLCASGTLKRLLFHVETRPDPARMAESVEAAVDVFLRAYGR